MKKRIFLLLLVLVLFLTACGTEPVKTVEYRGMAFTLDTENGIITQEGNVYRYEIAPGSSGTAYTITYPDGASYTMTWSGAIGTGGGAGGYFDADRLDGDILIDLLRENQPEKKEPAQYLLCLLVVGVGVLHVAAPYAVWYLRRGWHYRDAEPSALSLAATRIGGIVLIIFGAILFFV